MRAEKLWAHDAFFAYVDRWMTEDDAPFLAQIARNVETKLAAASTDAEKKVLQDAKAKVASQNKGGTITGRSELVPIVRDLWTKYRDNLPPAPDGGKAPPAETTWK
jgi:hypothetical protein